MIRRHSSNCAGSACALLLIAGSCAVADEPESHLEEIVVTATKDERSLSRVPLSIAAFTQEAMDVRAIRDVRDVVAQTPGLDLTPMTSGGARVAIRGIDSSAGAATTAIYLDETPMQSRNAALNYAGSTFPQIFDLERVEVLRGPQGTLFGASAQGGAIRFITPTPSLTEYGGYARAMVSTIEHGSESYEAGAAMGGPIVEDQLGFRISASHKKIGGYIKRVSWQRAQNQDDNVNEDESDIVRASLLWQPASWLSVLPSIYYQRRRVDDGPSFWMNRSDPDNHEFISGQAIARPYEDRFTLPSLKVTADWNDITFTSVTAYYDRDVRSIADSTNSNDRSYLGRAYLYPVLPGTAEIFSIGHQHTEQQDFTQEFRVGNMGSDARLRWQAGIYYANGKLHSDPRLETRHQGALYLYVTGRTMLEAFGSDNIDGIWNYIGDEHTKERSIAAFLNVDYSLTDRLILTLGGRISKDKLEFSVLERGPDYGVTGQQSAAGVLENEPFTPKVALTFQADASNMLYVSYAQGYRTGGINKAIPNFCAGDLAAMGISSPRQYEPDRTDSYEIGTKNRLAGGRVQLEASIFHVRWQDIQQQIRLPCAYSLVSNTGSATSKGFDVNLNVEPLDDVILSAAVGYNKAEYDSSITVGTRPLVFKGQTLGQTPWTVNVAAEYHFQAVGRDAFARAQFNYRTRNDGPFNYQNPAFSTYDPTRFPSEATRKLDLRTGMSIGAAEVSLFVENLLDEAPVLDFLPIYIGAPLQTARTLQPRTWGLMTTMRF